MRKQPFTVGSYVHVVKRGQRKMPIIREDSDKWRFLTLLRYLNDEFSTENWIREINDGGQNARYNPFFKRPSHWPTQRKLVSILAFCLMPNHFHLLLKEIQENGISRFMQKLGNSMTAHFNLKYEEVGSLFQGAYRSKTIEDDRYLRYAAFYTMVKNPMELFPGGLKQSRKEFEKAYEFASSYPFCSLSSYDKKVDSLILDKDILGEIIQPEEFKEFSRDCLFGMPADLELGNVKV